MKVGLRHRCFLACALWLTPAIALSQAALPQTRLQGHLRAWATAANDAGPVSPDIPLRLTLVLARPPAAQAALDQLLADLQDPASSRFHQWLTPELSGSLYGPTQHDRETLTAWLQSAGFTVDDVAPTGTLVSVTAPASVAAAAFSTSFRYFTVPDGDEPGTLRLSAVVEPAIPAAFASLITSIVGLVDTPVTPQSHAFVVPLQPDRSSPAADPRFTYGVLPSHLLVPGDFATIFDLTPAYKLGFTGTGQKVAIIGRSRVLASDVTTFQSKTGLPANLPNVVIPPLAGADPGLAGGGDQVEATLDVDRVLATAPGVQADLVVATSAVGGVGTAAQYEVYTLQDPVMTISFGSCETSAGDTYWDTLFKDAASFGISVFVSSGDSGAAACDGNYANGFPPSPSPQVLSINTICASTYATCVGGTEFADTASPSTFWAPTNNPDLSSALGYIPEGAWNDPSSTNTSGITTYAANATGGGGSLFIFKAAWQTGTGVPPDIHRDVPDISFPSSAHDGYYMCMALIGADCVTHISVVYGTSVAAPAIAAVAALLNQKSGARQGNLNPLLYRLAASAPGAFHDATPATSGLVVCDLKTPSMCNNSTPSPTSLAGGLPGYPLTVGYDQATGLGSLDVAAFLKAAVPLIATSITLTASASTLATGQNVTFTAVVSPTGSAAVPTGTIQFQVASLSQTTVALAGASATSPPQTFNTPGTFVVTAAYSGDALFAGATDTVSVVVNSALVPAFQLSAASSTLSLTAGATANNTDILNLGETGNFIGTVNLGCSVAYTGSATPTFLPTCVLANNPIAINAAPTSTTLTVHTTLPHFATARAGLKVKPTRLAAAALLAGLFLCLLPIPRRIRWRILTLLFVLTAANIFTGCGSANQTAAPPSPSTTAPAVPVGTTPGSYIITVTATSPAAASNPLPITIALTVN